MIRIWRDAASEGEILAFYDRMLARWPAEVMDVPTRHGRTRVLACGAGPALVLLHGSASNALTWMADAATWQRSFRVLAVDIPGEPGRSEAVRASWNNNDFVEWMDDLLDGLGLPDVSVVGLSLGGWIGLRYATARPERVRSLVMLAPSGLAPNRTRDLVRIVVLSMLGPWGRRRLTRLLWHRGEPPEEVFSLIEVVGRGFRPRLGSPPVLSDADLSRLSMPVMLRVGAHDVLVPTRDAAARLHRLVPHADVRVLEDQGHALHDLTAEILHFLLASEPQA